MNIMEVYTSLIVWKVYVFGPHSLTAALQAMLGCISFYMPRVQGILDAAVCFFIPLPRILPLGAGSVTDIFSVGKNSLHLHARRRHDRGDARCSLLDLDLCHFSASPISSCIPLS
jgi:hypothetical protein